MSRISVNVYFPVERAQPVDIDSRRIGSSHRLYLLPSESSFSRFIFSLRRGLRKCISELLPAKNVVLGKSFM